MHCSPSKPQVPRNPRPATVSGRLPGIVVLVATSIAPFLSLPGCQEESKDAILEMNVETFSLGGSGANPTLALTVTLLASNRDKSKYCAPSWYGTGETRPEWANLKCRAKDFVFEFSAQDGIHKTLGIQKGQQFDGLIWAWVEVFWIPPVQDDKPKLIYRNLVVLDHFDLAHKLLEIKGTDLCIPFSESLPNDQQIPTCFANMDVENPYSCLIGGNETPCAAVPDTTQANVDHGWCISGQKTFGTCVSQTDSCGKGGCEPEKGENPQTCPQDCGISQLVAGGAHNCLLTYMGEVFCWGDNSEGQCGAGDTEATEFAVPHKITFDNDTSIASLAAGGKHTCALDNNGSVWCWGSHLSGQLGIGDQTSYIPTPREIPNMPQAVQIAAGSQHTCALDSVGSLWCWGDNRAGQLGIGLADPDPVTPPQRVTGSWSTIWAGGNHTCATDNTGHLDCWGANDRGQLGLGFTSLLEPAPVPVQLSSQPSLLSLGQEFTCAAQDASPFLHCWGANDVCQLGMNGASPDKLIPTEVPDIPALLDLSSGGAHSCGIQQDPQEIFCWGGNARGQTGQQRQNSDPICSPASVTLDGMPTIVAAGSAHTCAVAFEDPQNSDAQVVWCWGDNTRKQLGSSPPEKSASPLQVQWQ